MIFIVIEDNMVLYAGHEFELAAQVAIGQIHVWSDDQFLGWMNRDGRWDFLTDEGLKRRNGDGED